MKGKIALYYFSGKKKVSSKLLVFTLKITHVISKPRFAEEHNPASAESEFPRVLAHVISESLTAPRLVVEKKFIIKKHGL